MNYPAFFEPHITICVAIIIRTGRGLLTELFMFLPVATLIAGMMVCPGR